MKFPRVFHLPESLGITSDDKVIESAKIFDDMDIVITEKMDGENTCLETHTIHARSENSKDHPSRHFIKAIHSQIRYQIPFHLAIYGENLFAKHSIEYSELPIEMFLIFAVIDKNTNTFLSWKATEEWAYKLNMLTVPVIKTGKGVISIPPEKSVYGNEVEGFVVRNVNEFQVDKINENMAKWVRADHVKTDEHWTKKWIPNRRRK